MQRFSIYLLGETDNERGDLFSHVTQAFFASLGYQQFRANVGKAGREIDVHAEHQLEARSLVAECKAHRELVGGSDINKFVGALGVERHKNAQETIGYFISLSGFRESAIEQENDAGGKRVILVTGDSVIERLIAGNVLVSASEAYAMAGACAGTLPLVPDADYSLIVHRLGLLWLIFYTENKARTHFALIHADGQALAQSLADSVINSADFRARVSLT